MIISRRGEGRREGGREGGEGRRRFDNEESVRVCMWACLVICMCVGVGA